MAAASTDQIKSLALRARVCGLGQESGLPEALRQAIDDADQAKRLLSEDELRRCCRWSGVEAAPLIRLQQEVPGLVDQARSALLSEQPDLIRPGGKLYPETRARACWTDCFHFLRVSLYGAALGRTQITDSEGMRALAELYALLDVPVPALLSALKHLSRHSVAAYTRLGGGDQGEALGTTLTHISNMIYKQMKEHDAAP